MAAGVPVVGTRVGGVPYLVDDGRMGYVVSPGDVAGLAESIVKIVGDPRHAAALGAGGRTRAEERFRLAVVSEQVRAMYDDAVNRG
jgi:glycosyltransferase involved in cell wall biosynthesis